MMKHLCILYISAQTMHNGGWVFLKVPQTG